MRFPNMVAVFSTWDYEGPAGRICHAVRSMMNDSTFGGFQFLAFCGASEHSDEVEYDVGGSIGCLACRRALELREREIGSADAEATT